MTTPLAVRCQGVRKSYRPNTTWGDWIRFRFQRPAVVALANLDLSLEPGVLVGLAGPNGAGKSTLLRSIAGLLTPDEGLVEVCGRAVGTTGSVADIVGYALSDERSHFWRLTGQENLRFFAALHGLKGQARDDRIADVSKVVDLEKAMVRPVREYSTGMRQRLSLARALLGQPDVLLLDEPTRGLDPGNAQRFRAFVGDELVGRLGKTVLYATHQVDEMQHFCPRVVLMQAGRIVADGPFGEQAEAFEAVFSKKDDA